MTNIVLAGLFPLVLMLPSGEKADEPDLDAIRKTALDYGQGWYEGNAERMERALHPDLAKRVLVPDPRTGKGRIDHMSAMTLETISKRPLKPIVLSD